MSINPSDISINIEGVKSFTPSYEQKQDEVPFTPPSMGEKLVASILTATVWTGVLMTLPISYFWVFKKPNEKEQIRVRRLGLLRESSATGTRVPVLPFIDTELRFSLDEQRYPFQLENVLTADKCAVNCSGAAYWRISDTTKCCHRSANPSEDASRLVPIFVRKQISNSTIREVATEQEKIERKILWKLQDELDYIGLVCERIEMTLTPSKHQPFINPAEGDMGGICGSMEQMNSQNHLLQDMFAGMAGHPGFANIVASVVQTAVEQRSNEDTIDNQNKDESDALLTPKMSVMAEIIRNKRPSLTDSILIVGSTGEDILIEYNNVQVVPSNTKSASCQITIPNETLSKILTQKQSYTSALASGNIQISGDTSKLPQLLPYL